MAITGKSKIKEILENEKAMEIMRKHMPGIDDPRTKQAGGLSLKALMAFPQSKIPKDVQKACIEELEAANIE